MSGWTLGAGLAGADGGAQADLPEGAEMRSHGQRQSEAACHCGTRIADEWPSGHYGRTGP
eukprot:SAG22_NODE_584_length_8876_cov_42.811667_4_plen_60_part_00